MSWSDWKEGVCSQRGFCYLISQLIRLPLRKAGGELLHAVAMTTVSKLIRVEEIRPGLGRDKVCADKRIFKSLGITEERPGRAGSKDLVSIRRHVESGLSQLCLQTVLRDAGTTRTSREESQQVHVRPRKPSSVCALVYDRWRQEVMSHQSQRWTSGRRCLRRTDWVTRPLSPLNPPHWEASSPSQQVMYANQHHMLKSVINPF